MSNKIASKPSQIDTKKKSSVREILLSLSAAVVLGWLVLGAQSNLSSAAESHFMGGNPHRGNGDNIRASRLVFPAGVRSNWHTHTIGQLLMVEKGRAVTQSRGGPVLEMHQGDSWYTPSGREHWHGAHPDEELTQLTVSIGSVTWLEGVSDAQYNAERVRP